MDRSLPVRVVGDGKRLNTMETVISFLIVIQMALAVNYDKNFWLHTTTRAKVATLKVKNGGGWGKWVHTTYCPRGTFARGYSQKIEPYQGGGSKDDTALNNIALFCSERHSTFSKDIVISPEPGWGKWSEPVFCEGEDVFMTSFILQVEKDQGDNSDDSAANYANFRCRKFDGQYHRIIDCGGGIFRWGDYGLWSPSCPSGSAICGMRTKSEESQGSGPWDDDTALNDVIFYCCRT